MGLPTPWLPRPAYQRRSRALVTTVIYDGYEGLGDRNEWGPVGE
ncbi:MULTISPECIES: hypothetical protein [Haloarcula]|nr:hypothetical protein [Halomicroarcula sp. XH51]